MSDPAVSTQAQELSAVTKQLYDQNFQLAIHNKTLSVISKLYEISMSTLNVQDVCQRIVDTLVEELNFQAAILNVTTQGQNEFQPFAITQTEQVKQALQMIGTPLHEIRLHIDDPGNIVSRAMRENQRQITGNMLDILTPLVTQEVADDIENLTGVKTLIIYPIPLGPQMLGSLVVGLGKKAEDLSRSERGTLEEVIDLIAIAIDRAQLHESVRRANDELKKLDSLKDEFLSMASHELKSPMNAVKNYLWMALHKGKEHPEKLDEYLTIAYESIQRLIALVNDLLDVSRIQSGRVTLDIKPLDLDKILRETVEIYSAQAKAKNLSLSIQQSAPIQVMADDLKIRDVLNNLVSNAIKYTPSGSITIAVTPLQSAVRISVIDTGMGISEQDQAKLFQKFSRVGTSFKEMAAIEGTGLGLYIAKQFIEMMKGCIGLESSVGKGTTFWIELPRA